MDDDNNKIMVRDEENQVELDAAIMRYPDGTLRLKVWPPQLADRIAKAHAQRYEIKRNRRAVARAWKNG